ncbi:hypothetical protein [Sutcliffiella horikoshii]|uniref:hypothetical protein n=1 Tax=Sutcliffiella horikoshii TaxID=79883 RepID=UPI001F4324F2|nr:hypothetical protein [Sutcliffiella horikoshii]MCG1023582.1 hypothetical protein [Sutcliffiella horikoshii]
MEWIVISIIWGGLMLYFIIPFHKTKEAPENLTSIKVAMKISLKVVTFHRKVFLAFAFLLLTYLAIWYSNKDLAWYNEAHGVPHKSNTVEKLSFYLAGVTTYTLFIYFAVVVRRALSYMKTEE